MPVVLSSGEFMFSSDKRMSLTHARDNSDNWQLVIDPILDKDEGFYECQVNTRDKMSQTFKLNVERKS